MPAKAGERAQETGTFHCRGCKHTIRLRKGQTIPRCPCGSGDYDARTDEPGRKSSRRRSASRRTRSTRST